MKSPIGPKRVEPLKEQSAEVAEVGASLNETFPNLGQAFDILFEMNDDKTNSDNPENNQPAGHPKKTGMASYNDNNVSPSRRKQSINSVNGGMYENFRNVVDPSAVDIHNDDGANDKSIFQVTFTLFERI